MKRAFLWMVVPGLLIALGFAQAPGSNTRTEQTNIKGCLGGSDPNYTVVEDNTDHIFKITTSTVDLKQHLGQEVTLIGHNASAASSAATDSSFAVTELNIISEHCAAAAAAAAATVSTPVETAVTPAPATSAPAATTSTDAEAAVTPAPATSAPAATTSTVAEAVVTPDPVAVPAVTVATPAQTAVPALATATTAHETRSLPRPRRLPATPAVDTPAPDATTSMPSETVSTPAAATITPTATDGTPPSETASTPAVVAPVPTAPARGGSFWLLMAFAVVVIVLGTMAPLVSRWRKRKLSERIGAQNLSLTGEATSDQGKRDEAVPPKAA